MPESKGAPGAKDRPAELQRQMDQIGDRFLQRLLAELSMMEALVADLEAGDFSGLKDLELFAHRIHGSSAMFGFTAVSSLAGELEQLVSRVEAASPAGDDLSGIAQQFGLLAAAGRAAARSGTGN